MDVIIAREIFGWHYGPYHPELKAYSTDISPAFETVNAMQQKSYDVALESLYDSLNAGGTLYHARFMRRVEGNYGEFDSEISFAHAICIAELLAVNEE